MAEEVGGIVYEVGMDVEGLKKARNAREMNLDDSLNQERQQPIHLMVLITQQRKLAKHLAGCLALFLV